MINVKIIFKRIYNYLLYSNFNIREINLENDRKYLDILEKKYREKINKDNCLESYFYRSFLQYKCQAYKIPFFKKLIINSISLIAIPLLILLLIFSSLLNRNLKENILGSRDTILLGFSITYDKDLIPKSILENHKVISMNSKKFIFINNKEVWVFFKFLIKKFTFYFYFIFKLLVKITIYNYFCQKYKPVAIVDNAEFSFTSSIITAFLEKKNIPYINVMHGEKLFDIGDSFFRFSECYVWDKHYIDLFKCLYAYEKQFKIEIPPRHKKLKNNNIFLQDKKILKYYWASERKKYELLYIFNGLNKLRKNGFKIIVRYHPLHKEYFFKYVISYCDDLIIEKPECKDIYDSLLETNYVLATYSTVLSEANIMGKIPVINDYRDNILKLERLNYIIVNRGQYIPLSKLVRECELI